ncbi:hypothetical protein E4U54_002665 [Claviceps lovelessii]|nr:hypothetical protein E4U54_002665 [Claviceps lovelessii]
MDSSSYYDIYLSSQISQPHFVKDLGSDGEFPDATSHSRAFMSFMAHGDSAAKGLTDSVNTYRYLTPDDPTAPSPSIASEELSSYSFDCQQSCRSISSPDQDYGYSSPSDHSSLAHHAPSVFYPFMKNPLDNSHMSQLPLKSSKRYEDMERQGVWNNFARWPHDNVTVTAAEESMMRMPCAELNRDAQVQWPFHTQRTIKEEICVEQGIFQEPVDETISFPSSRRARLSSSSYSATEKSCSHMSSSPPTSIPADTHHGGSCCKSCKKSTSALNLAAKAHDSTSCQALYCLFAFAGCDCRCKGKNEWKRHLKTQHLVSRLYTCPECANKNFNRKDLFTQHYIRMHTTQTEREAIKTKKTSAEFDKMLQEKQAQADRDETVSAPEAPTCLFQGCDARFAKDGTAWEKCLDHVSKHLEAMVAGKEAYRDYKFTHDQLAHFEALGAIAQGERGQWVLGAQSNGERARENKKKIGKRAGDADDVECHKSSKRQKGNY